MFVYVHLIISSVYNSKLIVYNHILVYLFGNTNFGSVLISLIILSLSWHSLINADQAVLTLGLSTRLYFLSR